MQNQKKKNSKQLERHFKGVANHYRIDILLLIARVPNITLDEITQKLNGNTKTISEHTRRLVGAGLVNKQYKGRTVMHTLSPYGKKIHTFLKTFQHS